MHVLSAHPIFGLLFNSLAGRNLAQSSFQVTLHRLRSLVGHAEALQFREGRLTLNSKYCWIDAWAFEQVLEEAENRWKEAAFEAAVSLSEDAIRLYRGPFLEKDAEESWAISMSERLRSRFLRAVGKVGDHWRSAGEWEKARDCFQRGLDVDDLAEGFCQGLMTCYQNLGQKAEALSLYQRFEKRMKTVLGVEPTARTKGFRAAICKSG